MIIGSTYAYFYYCCCYEFCWDCFFALLLEDCTDGVLETVGFKGAGTFAIDWFYAEIGFFYWIDVAETAGVCFALSTCGFYCGTAADGAAGGAVEVDC